MREEINMPQSPTTAFNCRPPTAQSDQLIGTVIAVAVDIRSLFSLRRTTRSDRA